MRLQDEIEPGFTIDEADSDACRARLLAEKPGLAAEILAKELKRRERKASKAGEDDDQPNLFDNEGNAVDDDTSVDA